MVCIFLCPGCGLVIGFVCFPGMWGLAWLFCWLCPYAGVGCGVSSLVDWFFVLVVPVCGCLTAVYQVFFCIGLLPLFLCFRGGAVRFSFFGVF